MWRGSPLSREPHQCSNSSGRTLSTVTTASFSNCPGTDLCFGFLIYDCQSTLQNSSGTVRPPKLNVQTTWGELRTRDDRLFGPNNRFFLSPERETLRQGLFLEFHLPFSPLPVGFDSKAKTKMAADSVQVGKVDNCCKKCANFLQSFPPKLTNTLIPFKSSVYE